MNSLALELNERFIDQQNSNLDGSDFKNETEGSKVTRNPLLFEDASQPDILRAHQKDILCKKKLENNLLDISSTWIGQHFTFRHQKNIKLASAIMYFYLSSGRGIQTLGEEFCDIRQLDVNTNTELSSVKRLKLFICQELFPYFYEYFISKLNFFTRPNYAGIPLHQSHFRSQFNNFCQYLIPLIKDTKNYLNKIHLGSFYFGGQYYEWSKRICGIKYIFDRPVVSHRVQYHILGLLIFIQLLVSTFFFIKSLFQLRKSNASSTEYIEEQFPTSSNSSNSESNIEPDCVLCLEPRKYPTVAECGHIFCWSCIHDSCQNKPECPLCRQSILPQNLTRIYHYSPS